MECYRHGFQSKNACRRISKYPGFRRVYVPAGVRCVFKSGKTCNRNDTDGFLGYLFAALISFPLAILAAKNLTTSRLLRNTSKGIIAFTRTVPDIVFALIFVSAVGLGTFPGTLALSCHSIGMLGKLYGEAIEEIDPQPLEAVEAVGASRIQSIKYAVIPQILPSFVANTFYRFDVNVRASVVLGLVGAGGIGFELIYAMKLFSYREVASILIVIFIIIILSEKVSDVIRKRIIGEEVLK